MANYQDFRLIKTAVKKTKEDYGEKYNFSNDSSIAFCWFVLENIFNLKEDEIDEALTDTNYLKRQNRDSADDSGIDAVIARDSNIFIADTLSLQNKNQLKALNIEYLELKKNNKNCLKDFKAILEKLNIPFYKNNTIEWE